MRGEATWPTWRAVHAPPLTLGGYRHRYEEVVDFVDPITKYNSLKVRSVMGSSLIVIGVITLTYPW